jgi:hypothetical protein
MRDELIHDISHPWTEVGLPGPQGMNLDGRCRILPKERNEGAPFNMFSDQR